MNNLKENKKQIEIKEIDFDKIIKSVLSLSPKKNEEIKKKAKKERKK
jgi:hypothetical protein